MKKKLVSLVLCMALLSSLTVGASAEFTSTDSSNLAAIKNDVTSVISGSLKKYIETIKTELNSNTYAGSNTLRGYVVDIYSRLYNLVSINSTLSSLYSGLGYDGSTYDTLSRQMTTLLDRVSSCVTRITEVQTLITGTNNRVDTTNSRLSTINTNMQNLISAASSQNHSDLSPLYDPNFVLAQLLDGVYYQSANFNFVNALSSLVVGLNLDGDHYFGTGRTLYSRIRQLQEVLASDDDLALKNANKANEAAVKSDFVSGSSSKTSLGVSDFGNLKDVGGTFNDLTSLNGQSSISSFLSGLTSADTTGQGWFSEATRASLDAVSTPASSGTRLIQKTWRGEKSQIYTLEADTSVAGVKSVSGVAGSDLDPYNMAGFTDNYNWLWGDAS